MIQIDTVFNSVMRLHEVKCFVNRDMSEGEKVTCFLKYQERDAATAAKEACAAGKVVVGAVLGGRFGAGSGWHAASAARIGTSAGTVDRQHC